jgi:hypothetical protein
MVKSKAAMRLEQPPLADDIRPFPKRPMRESIQTFRIVKDLVSRRISAYITRSIRSLKR